MAFKSSDLRSKSEDSEDSHNLKRMLLSSKYRCIVTIQNQPEALAAEVLHFVSVRAEQTSTGCLAPYENDSAMQNPIGEADFHGFCIVTVKVLNSYDVL